MEAAAASSAAPLLIRVLMIGDSSVGKTSLVLRYDKRSFSGQFTTTIGVDYSDRLMEIAGRKVKLQIWDTAGQERFHSLTTSFFKRAEGFVVVFDLSQRSTFEGIGRWMSDISEQGKSGVNVVLVGNKCDLAEKRAVTEEEGSDLAKRYGGLYFETSAKENVNIDGVFTHIAEAVKSRLDSIQEKDEKAIRDSLNLAQDSNTTSRSAGGRNKSSPCCP
jgi:Ras-related protein Rab-8A